MKRFQYSFILMADDDRDDFLIVRDALREAGHAGEVKLLEDGIQLMDYLNHNGMYSDPGESPRPDLLLLDLNMPRKDGRTVLGELKSSPALKSLPVVVLTTSEAESDVYFCYDAGANSFITKPADYREWTLTMSRICSYWFELVRLPPKRTL